jgi:hypothetical protein
MPASAQNLPAVGFKNETPVPIIIQGCTIINGVQRRGMPLTIHVGRGAFDVNVPPGIRFYTIINANQPAQVLLRDFPVPLQGDLLLIVRPSQQNPGHVELVLPGAGP